MTTALLLFLFFTETIFCGFVQAGLEKEKSSFFSVCETFSDKKKFCSLTLIIEIDISVIMFNQTYIETDTSYCHIYPTYLSLKESFKKNNNLPVRKYCKIILFKNN